jgi:GNAT superfamily N-acetyltransferase
VIEAAPMRAGERRMLARMFAEAFVEDPGWRAVGPDARQRRWGYVRRICGGELWAARRAGGEVLVTRDGGEPSAAIVYFGPESRPASAWLTAAQSPGAALAGPGVLRRSLAADARMAGGHPHEPHLYVSLLAAHPQRQRGGRGRVLLQAAIDEAERLGVPAHLDTANPANLPYYHGFGFVVTGEAVLPRGAPLWFLQRG